MASIATIGITPWPSRPWPPFYGPVAGLIPAVYHRRHARLTLAGEDIPFELRKGYARVIRIWQSGESLVLHLDMSVEWIYPHPAMRENVGSIALRSGPLIYCLETSDNPLPLHQIYIPTSATFEKQFVPDLLGGITLLTSEVRALEAPDWAETLYRTTPTASQPHTMTAIPYYAWDHREPGEMRVWLRTVKKCERSQKASLFANLYQMAK